MNAPPSADEQDVPAEPAESALQAEEPLFAKEELQDLAKNLDTTVLALLGLC